MIGQTISHYRIVEQLGAGGMGVVYKAEDLRLKRAVALKFLPAELTRDDEARQRLMQEAQAASALDHPNICVVYEIDHTPDGRVFIAMGYYEGETLKQRIARGPLPVDEAVAIGTQVAAGLAAAHEAGIIHRDVKPANIMLTRRGEAKLVDFGIAKLPDGPQVTRTGTTIGTVAYMAPEQIAGEATDAHADVWALGVVLYEMLTGRLPFTGTTDFALMNAITQAEVTAARTVRPEVPAALDAVVTRALTKEPAKRYADGRMLLDDLQRATAATSSTSHVPPRPVMSRRTLQAVAAAVLVAAAMSGWWVQRSRSATAERVAAVERIRALIEQDDYMSAFLEVTRARNRFGADADFAQLAEQVSVPTTLRVDPAGVRVSVRDPAGVHEWHELGTTPLENVMAPFGTVRWKLEKEGYETRELLAATIPPVPLYPLRAIGELKPAGSTPPGMVLIPASPLSLSLLGYDYNRRIDAAEYFVDEHEVTNRQFKEFVDAGGYTTRTFWKEPVVVDGRTLTWDEAISRFRDQTGRPGPATWEAGTYPPGADDVPVGGVSWFEAVAYAEYRGRSLPTIYHWVNAAGTELAAHIVPHSNIGRGGPVPVKTTGGISVFGLHDMAGNVKEWCANEMPQGRRYILGGSWSDPDYSFFYADARSPLDRAAQNGFRTALYPSAASVPAETRLAIARRVRDYATEKPVSDEVFKVFTNLFAYDAAPLDARIEAVDDTHDVYRRERVTFAATYGSDRVIAQVYLPKQAQPPYQAVVFWPGSGALRPGSSDNLYAVVFQFLLASGRAVVMPVMLGALERFDGRATSWPETSRAYRDWVTKQVTDVRRTLDYLETRSDLRSDALGYLGSSWGARMASLVLAQDSRPRAAAFISGGFNPGEAPPEVDPFHFAPRVTIPTLMINGNADQIFESETSQKPLYASLGTPSDHKRYVLLDAGHGVFGERRSQVIREVLDWFDRYLGKP